MDTPIIVWLVVLVLAIVIEITTLGLASIWFAGGALVAVIVAACKGPIWLQIVLFVVVSALLLIFTRPFAVKYFNRKREKTNVDALIGARAIVTSPIDNIRSIGTVTVNGQEWSARSDEELRVLQKGVIVNVVAVSGVKLIVKPDPSVEDLIDHETSDAVLDPQYIDEMHDGK